MSDWPEGVQLLGLGELFPGPYFALTEGPFWRELAEGALEGPTITTTSPHPNLVATDLDPAPWMAETRPAGTYRATSDPRATHVDVRERD